MVIAVDFDGTLCIEEFPAIGAPLWDTINLVKQLHKEGHTIILNTCRTDDRLGVAVAWCKGLGIPLDYVNENVPWKAKHYGVDCRKISADIYIEDRAINYSTRFNSIKEFLDNMQKSVNVNSLDSSQTSAGSLTIGYTETKSPCDKCIHKNVCLYKEKLNALIEENKLEFPFSITCYHKQEQQAYQIQGWNNNNGFNSIPCKNPVVLDDYVGTAATSTDSVSCNYRITG